MTPERIPRHDDEGLYQPRIHSRWIRRPHQISAQTGEPMTVLLDQALREYVARYEAAPSPNEPRPRPAGKGAGEGIPFHKTYEIVGWVYEAELHCLDCARRRFGEGLEAEVLDREGNAVTPLFLEGVTGEDRCGDCGRAILEGL